MFVSVFLSWFVDMFLYTTGASKFLCSTFMWLVFPSWYFLLLRFPHNWARSDGSSHDIDIGTGTAISHPAVISCYVCEESLSVIYVNEDLLDRKVRERLRHWYSVRVWFPWKYLPHTSAVSLPIHRCVPYVKHRHCLYESR